MHIYLWDISKPQDLCDKNKGVLAYYWPKYPTTRAAVKDRNFELVNSSSVTVPVRVAQTVNGTQLDIFLFNFSNFLSKMFFA